MYLMAVRDTHTSSLFPSSGTSGKPILLSVIASEAPSRRSPSTNWTVTLIPAWKSPPFPLCVDPRLSRLRHPVGQLDQTERMVTSYMRPIQLGECHVAEMPLRAWVTGARTQLRSSRIQRVPSQC